MPEDLEGSPLPARTSSWLAAPPEGPDLLNRLSSARWEVTGVVVFLIGIWAANFSLGVRGRLGILVLSLYLVAASARMLYISRTRRALRNISHLVDHPSPIPQFAVEVRFFVSQVAYGDDQGLLSFVDGWIHFQGLRSTFSIAPGHAHHHRNPGHRLSGSPLRMTAVDLLAWSEGQVPYAISITALGKLPGEDSDPRREFRMNMIRWAASVKRFRGSPVYPPQTPQAAFLMRCRSCITAWGAVTGLATVGVLIAGWPRRPGAAAADFCVLIPLAALVAYGSANQMKLAALRLRTLRQMAAGALGESPIELHQNRRISKHGGPHVG